MIKNRKNQDLENLYLQLQSENLINLADLNKKNDSNSPFYLKLFQIFSAWLSSVFFISFVFAILENFLSRQKTQLFFFIGIILCLFSIFQKNKQSTEQSIFLQQLMFTLFLVGEVIVINSLFDWFKQPKLTTFYLIFIILQIIIFFVYNNFQHRFFSVIAIIIALILLSFEIKSTISIYLTLSFLVSGLLIFYYFEEEVYINYKEKLEYILPANSAIIIAFLLFFIITLDFSDLQSNFLKSINLKIIISILDLALFYLIIIISKNLDISSTSKLKIKIFAIITLLIISILTYKSPGIIAALFIFLLSFADRNFKTLIVSAFFLVFYLIFFYYNMNLNLLTKSYILFFTGVLLLSINILLNKLFKFNQQIEILSK